MLIIKTNYRTVTLSEDKVKCINRGGKGTSLRNLLNFKKDEIIIKVKYE